MDLEKPDKLVANLCIKNDINYISSLPYFKDRENKSHENLFFPKDGHWTKEGTNVIANFLNNLLVSSLSNNSQ